MQIDERTYYEEEQRMDSKWVWFFAFFSFLTVVGIGVAIIMDKKTEWMMLSMVLGFVIITDLLMIYLFRTMKLEIAISKRGFHYHFFALFSNKGTIEWNEIEKLSISRSPYRSYGKKYSFRNGQVFTMNTKKGIRMDLKNGKKKFFSIKDVDTFRASYKKLELSLILEA